MAVMIKDRWRNSNALAFTSILARALHGVRGTYRGCSRRGAKPAKPLDGSIPREWSEGAKRDAGPVTDLHDPRVLYSSCASGVAGITATMYSPCLRLRCGLTREHNPISFFTHKKWPRRSTAEGQALGARHAIG